MWGINGKLINEALITIIRQLKIIKSDLQQIKTAQRASQKRERVTLAKVKKSQKTHR